MNAPMRFVARSANAADTVWRFDSIEGFYSKIKDEVYAFL
jgi:hypothetical protein